MPPLFTLSKTFAQNKPYSENLKWFPSLQIHNFDVLLKLAAVGKLLRMPFLVGKNILDSRVRFKYSGLIWTNFDILRENEHLSLAFNCKTAS